MKEGHGREIRREEYRPPAYLVDRTDLTVELDPTATRVRSRLEMRRNPAGDGGRLVLDGEGLELEALAVNGRVLAGNEYSIEGDQLTIFDAPAEALVETTVVINPEANTALSGLYISNSMFCTQCEAEGFRRITWYPDRPDVMSSFRTTIVGDASRWPVMLSNGNEIDRSLLDDGRTSVTWEDPHRKPAYLFALVAGDLSHIEDEFVTASGRHVRLQIYSEDHNIDQCHFAMDALKRSMRWDEETYGREYDLDIFMIVAVDHFNFGAMENKGLNVFNTSCVLAAPETTTDQGYQRVEAVVAHEYFHNWSGNRVTCRDWFQLSLKEGFTVYRDASFSGDMGSHTVKRIEDVGFLRTVQFPEDASPMAHPIRPDSYQEINNFYTATVYEKGAEVVGMLATLLGRDGFRKGADLYFERHDGQAVTTDDFVAAMEAANDVDLGQFRRWYAQAGTPRVAVESSFDAATGELRLDFEQSCPPTPGQDNKAPMHIPVAWGLIDPDGRPVIPAAGDVLADCDVDARDGGELLAHLKASRNSVTVRGLSAAPAVSMLRGFSAPVQLQFARSASDLAHLVRFDVDGFARWDAAQTLFADRLLGAETGAGDLLLGMVGDLLAGAAGAPDDGEARAMLAATLTLPATEYLAELAFARDGVIHIDQLEARGEAAELEIAEVHADLWREVYESNAVTGPFEPSGVQIARRALRARALSALALVAGDADEIIEAQYRNADNMTERLAALRIAVNSDRPLLAELRETLLADFLERFRSEALVVDLWFSTQSGSSAYGSVERVRALHEHPAYDPGIPNKVRALVGGFAQRNVRHFHAADGSGYAYLADQVIEMDPRNPQVAARLLKTLSRWRRFDAGRQQHMRAALQRVIEQPELSPDTFEVASKSLE